MASAPSSRPGGLTALCVLTIVLGAMGLLGGFVGVAGMLFQDQMQSAVAGFQPDPEMAKVQKEINEQTNELVRQHVVRNSVLLAVRISVAIGLLLGGIRCLGLKAPGRIVLLVTFGVGIVLEIFQLWPAWDSRQIAGKTFERMAEAQQKQANAPADFGPTMKVMGQVIAAMTFVMAVGLFLAKSAFYGFGLWYLTRPRVTALFTPQQPVDPQWA